jgi:hypothetical protein
MTMKAIPTTVDFLATPQRGAVDPFGSVYDTNPRVIYGLIGDSNCSGFDSATADWTAKAADLPAGAATTFPVSGGVWNKWTVGATADRSSAVDTGDDFRAFDLGVVDPGGGKLGTGHFAQSSGCECAFAFYETTALRAAVNDVGLQAMYVMKYGVAGSVVHDAPANPAAGWHPSGASTGAFKIFTNYYVRPALTRIFEDPEPTYYGGTIAFLGGTDAIDPGGVLTDAGDAELVATNIQAVIQQYHEWLGVPRALTALVIPPRVASGGTSFTGYPNMPLVQDEIRRLAARRNAAGYRTATVDLGDCERISDYLHYSSFGQWQAGRLISEAMGRIGRRFDLLTAVPAVFA